METAMSIGFCSNAEYIKDPTIIELNTTSTAIDNNFQERQHWCIFSADDGNVPRMTTIIACLLYTINIPSAYWNLYRSHKIVVFAINCRKSYGWCPQKKDARPWKRHDTAGV